MEELGSELFQSWENGRSWQLGNIYIVVEQSPVLTSDSHDRLRPGLNHLAFHAGSAEEVDGLVRAAVQHGWVLLFAEAHPYSGEPEHYAAYLSNADGLEVELVAELPSISPAASASCPAMVGPDLRESGRVVEHFSE